jgi:hypothetical protein
MKKSRLISSLAILCLMGISTQSQALYCDETYAGSGLTVLEGNSVCFLYDANDVSPLYGTLSVSGDNIFATPDSFIAASADGGSQQTTGIGTVRVVAKQGFELQEINVAERGNYIMSGSGSSVDVDASLDIFDWNAPLFGSYDTSNLTVTGNLTLADGSLHNWSASTSFDLTTAMWNGIDDVGLTLTNVLTAGTSMLGESASIQKTLSGTELITIFTTPIPVPAAVWLFGSGLLGLAAFIRRRK